MNPAIEPSSGSALPAATPVAPRPRLFRRILRWLGTGLVATVMSGMLAWAALAVYVADTHNGPRTFRAALVTIAMLAAALLIRPRRYGVGAFAAIWVLVLGWFLALSPSNHRDWAPEVASLSWADVNGDRLTVHNIRNFEYRSETDFTSRWVDRTYDLAKLRSGDLMLVYWGSKAIAHAMVSFGFEDGQYLAVSIETRKEKTESYSTVQGFFRQYELCYVFADERDVIGLRTNHRKEDVYLYRTTLTRLQAREVLMSYVHRANTLKEMPEFYNALTSNCATNVLEHARQGQMPAQLTWEVLLSGYAARQAYRNGRLDKSMPFEQLEARSRINDAAREAADQPEFSTLIRVGLPDPAHKAEPAESGTPPPTP